MLGDSSLKTGPLSRPVSASPQMMAIARTTPICRFSPRKATTLNWRPRAKRGICLFALKPGARLAKLVRDEDRL